MKQESCWPITSSPCSARTTAAHARGGAAGWAGTPEQTLQHLDNMPSNLTSTQGNFLSQTPILQALQHVRASCDEPTKRRSGTSSAGPGNARPLSPSHPRAGEKQLAPAPGVESCHTGPVLPKAGSNSAWEEEDTKPKPAKQKWKGPSAVGLTVAEARAVLPTLPLVGLPSLPWRIKGLIGAGEVVGETPSLPLPKHTWWGAP